MSPAVTRRVAEPQKMGSEPVTNPAVTRRATEPPRPSFEAARSGGARPLTSAPPEVRRSPSIPAAPRPGSSVRPLPFEDAEAVPASARAGDASNESAAAAMAALAPAPRQVLTRTSRAQSYEPPPPSTLERPTPNPLESSAADLELMAALAAVPTKRPSEKLAWAPPKMPSQARAQTVAMLSSQAAAALKGEKAPSGSVTSTGQWRAVTTSSAPAPAAARTTTLRSPPNVAERAASLKPSVVVIPSPPAAAPLRSSIEPAPSDALRDEGPAVEADGVSLRETESDARANAAVTSADGISLRETESDARANAEIAAAEAARAVDALNMRGGSRASLPDTAELLRDAPAQRRTTGRGSVVDPLELYGAATPSEKPPEQSLPKVMVQVPAKSAVDPRGFSEARSDKATITAASVRAAAESKAALVAAEAKAAAATAEASSASKPKVDLPPRVEPRPFPKPPPRRIGATETGEHPRVSAPLDTPKPETKPATRPQPKPETKRDVRPSLSRDAKPIIKVPPLPVPHKPLSPDAIWDVGPLDDAPLGEDEIPIDVTPDAPEATAALPREGEPPLHATHTSDSGRFDLQQLMSAGPRSSSKKGLADNDLLSLAGDLFTDTSPSKIVPADLSALPKRGVSTPPPSAPPPRLIAPVALTGSAKTVAVSEPPPFARPGLRTYAPWMLLPVVAAGVAAIMIWQGHSDESGSGATSATTAITSGEPTKDTPPTGTGSPQPTNGEPAQAPPSSTATDSDKSSTKSDPGGASTSWRWTGSAGSATASTTTGGAPAPTAPATATTTSATKTAPAPTDTAPAAGGNEFNASAAKAALRNAAGAAAGCASEKPGVASVAITFAPSGRVTSSVVSGSFAGTTTGGCIASAMRSATVPPFDGGPVSVVWKVTLR